MACGGQGQWGADDDVHRFACEANMCGGRTREAVLTALVGLLRRVAKRIRDDHGVEAETVRPKRIRLDCDGRLNSIQGPRHHHCCSTVEEQGCSMVCEVSSTGTFHSFLPSWSPELAATFPGPPAWRQHVGQLRPIPRPWRISLPCLGIDGASHAMQHMKMPYELAFACDIDEKLLSALKAIHGEAVQSIALGQQDGDVLAVDPWGQSPVDGLIAGPPCPPFSPLGKVLSSSRETWDPTMDQREAATPPYQADPFDILRLRLCYQPLFLTDFGWMLGCPLFPNHRESQNRSTRLASELISG